MPFEPAPKESPAARLAALIELGRIANPDLKHGRLAYLHEGKACAIGFAVLATGVPRDAVGDGDFGEGVFQAFATHIGFRDAWDFRLRIMDRVVRQNDDGASLDEICLSLREGELAKVTA